MPYTEINYSSVDESWNLLDPRNPLKLRLESNIAEKLLYRGQSDA